MEENLNAKTSLSLVNETLRPETKTRPRRLTFSPGRDRDVPTFHETETRPRRWENTSRDRDVETETTSLPQSASISDLLPQIQFLIFGAL